ncbi:MAG TPA: carbohydrate-binding protein [Tepidisphaeraceae bacterium]|nr:carbohydrate-binding protein [Tepidisphaeraceae bacterium]
MPQRNPKGGRRVMGVDLGVGLGRLSRRLIAKGRGTQQYEAASKVESVATSTPAALEQLESRFLLSTFYVSTSGSDSNAGSLARPFRTIQRAANLAQPGDTVLVRGGTYRETVRPTRSGSGSSPITFKPYNGENVTISGADVVSGWSRHNGSIYKARQSWDLGMAKNQVFVDGQMMIEARWPNTTLNLSRPAKATADRISASSSSATLYDSALTQSAGTWNGATIHIVPGQSWFAQTGKVTSSSGGKLTFSYSRMSDKETPTAGDQYFLSGKFKALDAPTEWFRDPDGTLYLWTQRSDSPSGHTVEAKRRAYAFDLRGRSHFVIDGFNLFAATIASGSSSGIKLNDLDVKYPGHFIGTAGRETPNDSGIYLNGSNNSITNSRIAYGAGYGIWMYGSNSRAENNIVHDMNYSAGSSAGIRAYGSGHVIRSNTVYNVGREGIKIGHTTRGKVTHNVVHDVMLQTTDGGGIYTFGTNGEGTEIAYNRIYNVKSGGWGGVGVMLDNNSTNYVVHHNVVWNVNHGLKMNYASKYNKIYNNTLVGTDTSVNTASNPNFSGSVFKNNIFTKAVKAGSGATFSHNINPGTDVKFVNSGGGNFQLSSNSPAINRGTHISPYTSGYAGSAPDIGALEYGRAAFGAGANLRLAAEDFDYDYGSDAEPEAVEPEPEPVEQEPEAPAQQPSSGGATIQAEAFDAQSGVYRSSSNIGSLDSGDWVRYDDVDFGTGSTTFRARVALPDRAEGKRIEIRVGGVSGTLLGTLVTDGTGSWSDFETQAAGITRTSGVKDVYLVFKGGSGIGVLDSFSFA